MRGYDCTNSTLCIYRILLFLYLVFLSELLLLLQLLLLLNPQLQWLAIRYIISKMNPILVAGYVR